MQFANIPAHIQLKSRLIYLAKSGQIPHAHLFWGPPGSASLTLAMAFATYLNCHNQLPEDACGHCKSCVKMGHLTHPDLKFVFPIHTTKTSSESEVTSNHFLKMWYPFVQERPYGDLSDWSHHIGAEHKQLIIPTAEAKYINQYASFQVFEGPYKIILIWLPEYLHANAANALLKLVEDPPSKTIFLFVSMNANRLLSTLRSRLQQVFVPPFTDEATEQLIAQKHQLSPQKLSQIVGLAEGNLNKAYKLIAEIQDGFLEEFTDWMRACYAQDFTKLMKYVERFQEIQKENQKNFLIYSLYMMRQILLVQLGSEKMVRAYETERQLAEKLGQILNDMAIRKIYTWLNEAHYHIERNLNTKILFLNLSLRITEIFQEIRSKTA